MRTGHRDVERVAREHEVPRTADFGRQRGSLDPARVALRPRPRDGRHGFGFEVDRAEEMVFGIGHVEDFVTQGHPLRVVERRFGVAPVFAANRAGADHFFQFPGEGGDDDPVVVAVGDEQPVAGGIGQQLAWEPQRGRLDLLAFEVERDGCFIERFFGAVIGDQFVDHRFQQLAIPFAGDVAAVLAFRIDQHERRPGADTELAPDGHLVVVDDGMLDLVAENGIADVGRVFLVVELGRVDADDDDLVGVLLFEVGKVGQDMHAVDAAVGPEVEQDDLAAHILQGNRPADVEPFRTALEARRRKALGEGILGGVGVFRFFGRRFFGGFFCCG